MTDPADNNTNSEEHGTTTTRSSEGENVRVYLRLRPLNKFETTKRSRSAVEVLDAHNVVIDDPSQPDDWEVSLSGVLEEDCSEQIVYDETVEHLPQQLLAGYDCTVLAYGATGTGKTHTLLGGSGANGGGEAAWEPLDDDDALLEKGLCGRLMKNVFQQMEDAATRNNSSPDCNIQYTVRCSVLEIYLDRIRDLFHEASTVRLDLETTPTFDANTDSDRSSLVTIQGCSAISCVCWQDVVRACHKAAAVRTGSAVYPNRDSSRSTLLVLVEIKQQIERDAQQLVKSSRLQIFDLAGSEMAKDASEELTNNTSAGVLSKLNPFSSSAKPKTAIPPEAERVSNTLKSLHRHVEDTIKRQQQLAAVNSVDGTVRPVAVRVPENASTLERLLAGSLGGNSHTVCILTASPSNYSVQETIHTVQFGLNCFRLVNRPVQQQILVSASAVGNWYTGVGRYHTQLRESNVRRDRLQRLVKATATECQRLKEKVTTMEASTSTDRQTRFDHNLWSCIEQISLSKTEDEDLPLDFIIESKTDSEHRVEITRLKNQLRLAEQARKEAEGKAKELRDDLSIVQAQVSTLQEKLPKLAQELTASKEECSHLHQSKQNVEHNLRTSQFRESEAVVFLRQLRRFYFRLLKQMETENGNQNSAKDIIKNAAPGALDQGQLLDIDRMMVLSGLLEESEIGTDVSTKNYRPSRESLGRSTQQAEEATKKTPQLLSNGGGLEDHDHRNGEVNSGSSLLGSSTGEKHAVNQQQSPGKQTKIDSSNGSTSGKDNGSDPNSDFDPNQKFNEANKSSKTLNTMMPLSIVNRVENGETIEARQKLYQTPSGRYIALRENVLEKELIKMTQKCANLTSDLLEERANVDALANKTGVAAAFDKMRAVQEQRHLKEQMERKASDLKTVIFKMNELHVVSKTLKNKVADREQHVQYLEQNLSQTQDQAAMLLREKLQVEQELRQKIQRLRLLVKNVTNPAWHLSSTNEGILKGQDDGDSSTWEGKFQPPPLGSRLVVPFGFFGAHEKEGGENSDYKFGIAGQPARRFSTGAASDEGFEEGSSENLLADCNSNGDPNEPRGELFMPQSHIPGAMGTNVGTQTETQINIENAQTQTYNAETVDTSCQTDDEWKALVADAETKAKIVHANAQTQTYSVETVETSCQTANELIPVTDAETQTNYTETSGASCQTTNEWALPTAETKNITSASKFGIGTAVGDVKNAGNEDSYEWAYKVWNRKGFMVRENICNEGSNHSEFNYTCEPEPEADADCQTVDEKKPVTANSTIQTEIVNGNAESQTHDAETAKISLLESLQHKDPTEKIVMNSATDSEKYEDKSELVGSKTSFADLKPKAIGDFKDFPKHDKTPDIGKPESVDDVLSVLRAKHARKKEALGPTPEAAANPASQAEADAKTQAKTKVNNALIAIRANKHMKQNEEPKSMISNVDPCEELGTHNDDPFQNSATSLDNANAKQPRAPVAPSTAAIVDNSKPGSTASRYYGVELFQGGKEADAQPIRRVPDYGKTVTPGATSKVSRSGSSPSNQKSSKLAAARRTSLSSKRRTQ